MPELYDQDFANAATPGALLQRGREAKQWTQEHVAKQLNFTVKWVQCLENNNYPADSSIAYIKAYLRAYARIVELSPDSVLKALERLEGIDHLSITKSGINTRLPVVLTRTNNRSTSVPVNRKGTFFWVICTLIFLGVLAWIWWDGEPQKIFSSFHSFFDDGNNKLPVAEKTIAESASKESIANNETLLKVKPLPVPVKQTPISSQAANQTNSSNQTAPQTTSQNSSSQVTSSVDNQTSSAEPILEHQLSPVQSSAEAESSSSHQNDVQENASEPQAQHNDEVEPDATVQTQTETNDDQDSANTSNRMNAAHAAVDQSEVELPAPDHS